MFITFFAATKLEYMGFVFTNMFLEVDLGMSEYVALQCESSIYHIFGDYCYVIFNSDPALTSLLRLR